MPTSYQTMLPHERMMLVGKIVDLLVYDAEFCTAMIETVKLKEEIGAIKSKFFLDAQVDSLTSLKPAGV
jgi:hypothetical protein